MVDFLDPLKPGILQAAEQAVSNALVPSPAAARLTQDPLTVKPGQIPQSVATKIPVRTVSMIRTIGHGTSGGGYGNAPHGTHAVNRMADELTIELKWVAEHAFDASPRKAREALMELSDRQPDGSFNSVILTWGSIVFRAQFKRLEFVMSEGVDVPTMSELMLIVRVTLSELHQLRGESIADQVGEPSTTYHEVRASDTWASIAAEHYQNPDASVRLAQVNRGRMLEPGRAALIGSADAPVVRVLPADHSRMLGAPAPIAVELNELPLGVIQRAAAETFEVGPGGVKWGDLDPRFTAEEWSQ